MIFYKQLENRIYWKDIKALRYKRGSYSTQRQKYKFEQGYYQHKPGYNPNTTHCKGMYFGACQEP